MENKTTNQDWKYMNREDRAKELIKVYDIVETPQG